jgi:phospholipase/lecithinase/hemolysin
MNFRLAISAIALAALTACGGGDPAGPSAPSTAETARVFVFGDSLADGGTYSRGNSLILQNSAGVPKQAADLVGKFTNSPGAIWVEVLAGKLGTTIAPERFEVGAASPVVASNGANTAPNATNYAQGGSRVALSPGVGCNPNATGACTAQAAVPVSTQVDRALAKGNFNASDLVLIWGGANDVFFNATAAGAEITAVATSLRRALTDAETQGIVGKYVIAMETAALDALQQAKRLKAAGAQRVVVLTIPNAALTPFGVAGGPSTQGLLTALSGAFNNQLKKELQLQDPGIFLFDAGALSAGWYANPASVGFVNTQAPVCDVPAALGSSSSFCFITGATKSPSNPFLRTLPAGVTPANSMFADGVHPSLAAHALFGNAVYDALKAKGWVK